MKVLGSIIIVVSSCDDGSMEAIIESDFDLAKSKDVLYNTLLLVEKSSNHMYPSKQYTM